MSELRVAMITGNYNSVIDGVAMATNRQTRALLDAGEAVRVYAPVNDTPVIVPHAGDLVSIPSIPIVPPYRLALGLTKKGRDDLARFNPNLIHLATPDLLGFAAQEWARRRKIPIVTTFHTHFGSYLTYYRCGFLNPAYIRLSSWFYQRCDVTYVACQSMIDELKRTGIHANFEVMPFGVDTNRFTPAKRSDAWRAARGIAADEIVLLFVGRLVWEKGIDCFVKTSDWLTSRNVAHRVVVVGEGPAGPEFRKRLPRAEFLGRLMGDDLPTAFASSDIFFFPSASETFGLVSLEAIASGLPCVVAEATGSRDIVRHQQEGILCPPEDYQAFGAAIERLIRDPQMRAGMAASGVERAQGFRWPIVMDKMVNAFRSVARSAGRTHSL
ncbi:MAG: glycosyltransferase family 1 protein [Gemmataceae bacterium]